MTSSTPATSLRRAALLLLLPIIFSGCKLKTFGHTTSSSDFVVNGHATRTRTQDGISRRLETDATLEIKDGVVTKFPKGAIVKLQESGSSQPREAELRESENRLELWIKQNDSFRRGTPEDESWLSSFLDDFTTK